MGLWPRVARLAIAWRGPCSFPPQNCFHIPNAPPHRVLMPSVASSSAKAMTMTEGAAIHSDARAIVVRDGIYGTAISEDQARKTHAAELPGSNEDGVAETE